MSTNSRITEGDYKPIGGPNFSWPRLNLRLDKKYRCKCIDELGGFNFHSGRPINELTLYEYSLFRGKKELADLKAAIFECNTEVKL